MKTTVSYLTIGLLTAIIGGCVSTFPSPVGTWTVRHQLKQGTIGNEIEGFSTSTVSIKEGGVFTEILVIDLFNSPDPEPSNFRGQWRQDGNIVRFHREDSPATDSYVIDKQGLRMTGNVAGHDIVLSRKIKEMPKIEQPK